MYREEAPSAEDTSVCFSTNARSWLTSDCDSDSW